MISDTKGKVKMLCDEEDKCVWIDVSNRKFSTKAAWEACRIKGNFLGLSKMMWHNVVLVRCSFLAWRAVKRCLPLDDCIIRKGMTGYLFLLSL